MYISYRQGLVSTPTTFLVASQTANSIDIIVSPNSLLATAANGTADYLVTINTNVLAAFGPFNGSTTEYLYVDINPLTAIVTYGSTPLFFITAETAPISPALNQMWFDITNTTMYYWNGTSWELCIRVFLGTLVNGAIITQEAKTSQVGLNTSVYAGYILTDGFGNAFRNENGTLLTSETQLLSVDTGSLVKLDGAEINVLANESIPAFSCVYITDGYAALGDSSPSDYLVKSPIALVPTATAQNAACSLIFAGHQVMNQQWNWTTSQFGTYVYCGSNGVITLTPPTTETYVQVGIILTANSILTTFASVFNPLYESGSSIIEPFVAQSPLNLATGGILPVLSIPAVSSTNDGYMTSNLYNELVAIEAALPSFVTSSQTWPQSQIIGLTSTLAGYLPIGQAIPISQVTNLTSTLAGYLPIGQAIPISQVTNLQSNLNTLNSALNSKANLASGITGNFTSLTNTGQYIDSGYNASSFAAANATWNISSINGLTSELSTLAPLTTNWPISQVTGLSSYITEIGNKVDKVPSATVGDFATFSSGGDIQDSGLNASSFALVSATWPISSIINLQSTLNTFMVAGTSIPQSQVIGLTSTLAGYQPLGQSIPISQVTGLQTSLNSYVPLAGGTMSGTLNAPSIVVGTNILNNAGSISANGTVGTAGQVLTSQGSGSAVVWATPANAIVEPNGLILFGTGSGITTNALFSYNSNTDVMGVDALMSNTVSGSSNAFSISTPVPTTSNTSSGAISIITGVNNGTGQTGNITIGTATATSSGNSGSITFSTGSSTSIVGAINFKLQGTTRFAIDGYGTFLVNGSAGTIGQSLVTNGANAPPSWQTITSGGLPSGVTTSIQYNSSGSFAGSADFTWNESSRILQIGTAGTGTVGTIQDSTSNAGTISTDTSQGLNIKGVNSGTTGSINISTGSGIKSTGAINITAGTTGATSIVGSSQGAINITAGNNASTTATTGSQAGNVNISAGNDTGQNQGGNVNITAGNSAAAAGIVNITAGNTTGNVLPTGFSSSTVGGINITGGNSSASNSTALSAGSIKITGGNDTSASTSGNTGGNVTITSGTTTNNNVGYVHISGGALTSGSASAGSQAGNVTVTGGQNTGNGLGGDLSLSAGNNTNGSVRAGNVNITAGINSGSASNPQNNGSINFITSIDSSYYPQPDPSLTIDPWGTFIINGNAGTSGQVLTSQGTENAPVWSNLPSPFDSNYKQYSNTLTTTTNAASQILDSISATSYRCVKYQIQITSGSSYEYTEISILQDGTNTYFVQSDTLSSTGTLALFSSTITGGNMQLLISPVNASTTIRLFAVAIAV